MAVEEELGYRNVCPDIGINLGHEPNNCVRAAATESLTVAMRPTPDSLIQVNPDWIGKMVRAEAVIGNHIHVGGSLYWSPNFDTPPVIGPAPVDSRSCYAAWGWLSRIHASGLPYPDRVRATILFLNEEGVLIQPDGTLTGGTLTCDDPALSLTDVESEAKVRPVFSNFFDVPIAVASIERHVPTGAAYLGVRFDIPGVNLDAFAPMISDLTISLSNFGDPKIAPALSAGLYESIYGPSNIAPPPTGCADPSWFQASAAVAGDTQHPVEHDCLSLFAE